MSGNSHAFAERLRPAPRDGGFAMDDWWIWATSVVPGDDGDYHAFASRWSKEIPFSPGWTSNSHIVRRQALTPDDPHGVERDLRIRWDDGTETSFPTAERA